MPYILILMFNLQVGPRPDIRMQEFTSRDSCEAAKNMIVSKNKLERLEAECLAK